MKKKKINKNCEDILLSERINQIYAEIINKRDIRLIKRKKDKVEEKLEKILKIKLKEAFFIYCEVEEIDSQFTYELMKEYYRAGLKDGIKIILKNIT